MEPLTPPDCDLRDFAYMPLDVARLRDSDLASLESPEACWSAVLLWCASWHQIPAASLPDDDRILANLAGFGRVVKEWLHVKPGALRGWVMCSDGRLYHPVVAEKARESWDSRLRHAYGKMAERLRKLNKQLAEKNQQALTQPTFEQWISGGKVDPTTTENIPRSAGIPPENSNFPPENIPRSAGIPPENALKGEGEGKGKGKGEGEGYLNTNPLDDLTSTALVDTVVAENPKIPKKPEKMPPPAATANSHGTAMLADWVLPKAWGEWALQERPDFSVSEIRRIADTFRDHWLANANRKEGRKADWQAAWRNWVRGQKIHNFQTTAAKKANETDAAIAAWLGNGDENVIEGECHAA